MIKYFICYELLFVLFVNFSFYKKNHPPVQKKEIDTGVALIELFTSEGCSSCPAADKAVARIAADYPGRVYVLGFHVDYWNRLDWKDVFSKAEFTERQRRYASLFSLNSIYTPQVVVNGSEEFAGSDYNRLEQSVQQAFRSFTSVNFQLSAKNTANQLSVSFTARTKKDEVLTIAIVQLHYSSQVKSGENRGRNLAHINIVRDFKTLNPSQQQNGTVQLQMPEGLKSNEVKVIAFIQQKDNFRVTGVAAANVQ
jgi:hypothetical protein